MVDNAHFIEASHAKILSKIAEMRSFSATAAALGISQPSISQQVKRIESHYRCSLFARSNTGVELTSAGEAVIAYARAMVSLDKNLQTQLAYDAGRPRVCIGMSQDVCRTALPHVLRRFSRNYSDVELRVVSGSYEAIARGIETRSVDLAVVQTNTRIPNLRQLWTEKMAWVGHGDVQLPISSPVSLILPMASDPKRDIAIRALRSAGYTWRTALESDDLASIEGALHAGLGITLAPVSMQHHGARMLDASSGLPKLPDIEYAMYDPPPEAGATALALAAAIRGAAADGLGRADNAGAAPTTVAAHGCAFLRRQA